MSNPFAPETEKTEVSQNSVQETVEDEPYLMDEDFDNKEDDTEEVPMPKPDDDGSRGARQREYTVDQTPKETEADGKSEGITAEAKTETKLTLQDLLRGNSTEVFAPHSESSNEQTKPSAVDVATVFRNTYGGR